ncbi:hypothetical protein LIER_43720 [Lithospermum erythrorhizon]|uniref:RNase H type-1 domain-containing protein n=1 Tax=Lithospermum erythrorhizon TaxID=34254 RepID=A0AAV3QRU4_LITER
MDCISGGIRLAQDYKTTNFTRLTSDSVGAVGQSRSVTDSLRWKAPTQDWIKLNCDASWEKNNGHCSIGMVGRGAQGRFEGARYQLMQQVASSLVAEAMAFREGMSFAKENKWNRVVIESNSKVLVQALRGEVPIPVEIDVLVWDVLQWRKNMDAKFQFIRRSGNNAAHLVVH